MKKLLTKQTLVPGLIAFALVILWVVCMVSFHADAANHF